MIEKKKKNERERERKKEYLNWYSFFFLLCIYMCVTLKNKTPLGS
jgi:hypothetical protein